MYPYGKRTLERYLACFNGLTYIEVYNIKGDLLWCGQCQSLYYDVNADYVKEMRVTKCAIDNNHLIVSVGSF